MKQRLLVLLASFSLLWLIVPVPQAGAMPTVANRPIDLTFEKTAVAEGIWEGTVAGDIDGNLQTILLAPPDVSGAVWHVEFDWIVSAGSQSFTATMQGVLNTRTKTVVMNGTVTEGYMLGARVHEQGQCSDDLVECQGTIRIMSQLARD
jgi:hypothetical protein